MIKAFGNLFQPPKFEDPEQMRLARVLHVITIGAWLVPLTILVIALFFPSFQTRGFIAGSIVIIINLIAILLLRRGSLRLAGLVFILALTAVLSFISYTFNAQPRPYILFFAWIIILAGLLLGRHAATAVAVYFALLQTAIILLVEQGVIRPNPVETLSLGNVLIFAVAFLLISSSINLASKSIQDLYEKGRLNQIKLEQANQELTGLTHHLEERIASRTSELKNANVRIEKRARQFQSISQITRAIISPQNLQDLLPQIAKVISEQFDFYHVGIFLIDPNKVFAVLSAANSEGGERMLARSHKLRIGQTGIVGYVAKTGKIRVALDTGADSIYFNNPDLPNTRSEMALPLLHANGDVIGVLDIQSTSPNAFLQEDIEILTTLAEQVSMAMVNARQFEETQKALAEAEMVYRQELKTGWEKFSRYQKLAGIRRRGMKTSFLAEPVEIPGASEVTQSGTPFKENVENIDSTHLTMPVKLRGEVVGLLNLKAGKNREWSPDEMDVITAIIERAALTIENARLLDESRRIAGRERAISEISAKIGQGTEIESILRTAVRELGAQISDAQVTIEIDGGQE